MEKERLIPVISNHAFSNIHKINNDLIHGIHCEFPIINAFNNTFTKSGLISVTVTHPIDDFKPLRDILVHMFILSLRLAIQGKFLCIEI